MKKIFNIFMIMILGSFSIFATDWKFDNGVLTISKRYDGRMEDYNEPWWWSDESEGLCNYDRPWEDFQNKITKVVILPGVTYIGDNAFKNCENLNIVVIPEGVTKIGGSTFENCENLKSVVIPESLKEIDHSAFKNCKNLTDIKFPSRMSYIADDAFEGCDNVVIDVVFSGDDWKLHNGILTISGAGDMKNFTFQDNWSDSTVIGRQWENLKDRIIKADILKGVTSIGNYAFADCENLTSVVIPEGVTSIGNYAFSDCENLISIVIPEGVTSIGKCAFADCENLTSVVIPESVTSIGNYAFRGCENLTDVKILAKLTNIGDDIFNDCENIKINGVRSDFIIVQGKLLDYLGNHNASDIIIPEGVKEICKGVFENYSNLTNVIFPESLISIGESAFEDCYNLKNIKFPENLISIGKSAFEMCDFTNIVFPESLVSIGESAFEDCSNLNSVVIPENVTDICVLTAFLESGDGNFTIIDGDDVIVINWNDESLTVNGKQTDSLIFRGEFAWYRGKEENVKIPSNVTSIGTYAFCENEYVRNIIIPEGVTDIKENAFCECSNLTNIEFPKSLKRLSKNNFEGCYSLRNVTIPDGVEMY